MTFVRMLNSATPESIVSDAMIFTGAEAEALMRGLPCVASIPTAHQRLVGMSVNGDPSLR